MLGTGARYALAAALVFAVIDWIAVLRRSKSVEYVFKPATLIALTVCALFVAGDAGPLGTWFVAALAFSLVGDIFLMLPGESWFLPGLAAFLIGHICYLGGLNRAPLPVASLWLAPFVLVVDALVLPRVVRGARDRGDAGMTVPIVAYGLVLSAVLFSGWATWFRPGWTTSARLAASLGTTLFFVSDLMLAWDRFVRGARLLQVLVIVTYHLAQLALVLVVATA
jgi:uncharacterized membrane protein YhhN